MITWVGSQKKVLTQKGHKESVVMEMLHILIVKVYNEEEPGSVPGSERSPGEGNGNPLHYSCLENSMDRGAWQATVHGVTKGQTYNGYADI